MSYDAERPDDRPTPPSGAVRPQPGGPGLGDWLRTAREEAGLDLAAIASHTHVRAAYLEALEREDLAKLPEDVYARNFLRLHARALGLDEAEALERFAALRRLRDDGPADAVRDAPEAPPRATRSAPRTAPRSAPRTAGRPRGGARPADGGALADALRAAGPLLATVVVAGVVIGTAVWGFNQLLFDPTPAAVPATAPAAADAPAGDAPAAPADVASIGDGGPLAGADATDALAAPAGSPAANADVALSVTTDPPGARVTVDAFGLPGVTPIRNVPVTAQAERTVRIERDGYLPVETTLAFDRDREIVVTLEPEPDAPAPTAAAGGADAVRVVVEEASWLEAYQSTARGEGERLAYTTAQPGDTFTFERPVYLHVGNAGGLEVFVDGEPLVPSLGSRGAVTGRAFPEAPR